MRFQKNRLLVLFAVLLIFAIAGGAVFYVAQRAEEARQQQVLEDLKKQRAAAVKEYEDLLTGFVRDMGQEMKAYKTQRTVLREITRTHNFESKSDAQQNYEEYKAMIVPGLTAQADKVLAVFDRYGQKIEEILKPKPEDTRLFLQSRWMTMRDKEYQNYKMFFEADKRVLMGYQELLKFYADRFESYKIVEDKFVFNDPQDLKAEQELMKIIKDMQVSEKAEKQSP
jgi:cell division protein FtsB